MSKALRNVLTSIALVEAMVRSLEAGYRSRSRNKSLLKLTGKAIAASQEALKAWPGQIDPNGMRKIADRVGMFEKKYGEIHDFCFYSSMALGILSDIGKHIKNQHRAGLLDDLIRAIGRIHRYFDRDLKKTDVYDRAAMAVSMWHSMGA